MTILADALIEKSTLKGNSVFHPMVILAGLIYGLTAFGWFVVLKKTELLNAGVIYILFSLIFLAIFSLFYFKERLAPMEAVGLFLALLSIIILYKYAE